MWVLMMVADKCWFEIVNIATIIKYPNKLISDKSLDCKVGDVIDCRKYLINFLPGIKV
jgi:hypothetical protein